MLEGKDPFIKVAAKEGLLYVPIDEDRGWTIERRVGQQSSVMLEVIDQFNRKNEDRAIEIKAPKHAEIVEKGLGAFFQNPEKVPDDRIFKQ